MRRFLIFLSLSFVGATYCNAQWNAVIKDNSTRLLVDFDYVNNEEAFLWSFNHLVHTYDNWKSSEEIISFPSNSHIYWADFDNSMVGFAIIRWNSSNYALYSTANGGYSWDKFQDLEDFTIRTRVKRDGNRLMFAGDKFYEVDLEDGQFYTLDIPSYLNQSLVDFFLTTKGEYYVFSRNRFKIAMFQYVTKDETWRLVSQKTDSMEYYFSFFGKDKMQFVSNNVPYEFDFDQENSDTLEVLEQVIKGDDISYRPIEYSIEHAFVFIQPVLSFSGDLYLYNYAKGDLTNLNQNAIDGLNNTNRIQFVGNRMVALQGGRLVSSSDTFQKDRKVLFSLPSHSFSSMGFKEGLGLITSSTGDVTYTTDKGNTWTRTSEIPFNSFIPGAMLNYTWENKGLFILNSDGWIEINPSEEGIFESNVIPTTILTNPNLWNIDITKDGNGNYIFLKRGLGDSIYLFQKESAYSEAKLLMKDRLKGGGLQNGLIANEGLIAFRSNNGVYVYNRKTKKHQFASIYKPEEMTFFKGKLIGTYNSVNFFMYTARFDLWTFKASIIPDFLNGYGTQIWVNDDEMFIGATNLLYRSTDLESFEEMELPVKNTVFYIRDLKVWQNQLYLANNNAVYRKNLSGEEMTEEYFPVEVMAQELVKLGLPNAEVRIDLSLRTEWNAFGQTNFKLLFSPNKGMPLAEASKSASGGEISRLMLVLKAQLAKHVGMPTLIFDEIDTGVSGEIGQKMGQILQEMARQKQVICITHLPQIAAAGEHHYFVYKTEDRETTSSGIRKLSEEERVLEIAKMLSGDQPTDGAIHNAKELLAASFQNI
jgi:hypothetical protein